MKKIFLISIILSFSYFLFAISSRNKHLTLHYYITETPASTSFDPLDADKTQNLPVMRMMYLTPLEVDSNNHLTSKVLDSFSYDVDGKKIVFVVRNNLYFSDGSKLLTSDVEMAIKRMAYFRPDFPIIKDIDGVEKWANQKNGLNTRPSGLKVEGNKITIYLNKKKTNPLFRFCLELFSIIPSRCINSKSGHLTCDIPPESGYYKNIFRDEKSMKFKKRLVMSDVHSAEGFESIIFNYKSMAQACNDRLEKNSVITGNELDFKSANACKQKLESKVIRWLPSARFAVLRFNPNIKPFQIRTCRVTFANEVKSALKRNAYELDVESSLFTKILPGYLPENKLAEASSPACRRYFRSQKISLPHISNSSVAVISDAIIAAAKTLEMDISEVNLNPESQLKAFLSGQISVVAGSSGFWAQDPIGDMVMWFTPGLHKTMSFVWKDTNLYSLIRELDLEHSELKQKSEAERLNIYLSKKSIIVPVVHFKRMYITDKETDSIDIPQAITSPAPWQVLPMRL